MGGKSLLLHQELPLKHQRLFLSNIVNGFGPIKRNLSIVSPINPHFYIKRNVVVLLSGGWLLKTEFSLII